MISGEEWVSITPKSGSGKTAVKVKVKFLYGRLDRTTSVTIQTTTLPSKNEIVNIHQSAHPPFIQLESDNIIIDSKETSFSILGNSNLKNISFDLDDNDKNIPVIIPSYYMVDGKKVNNGSDIPKDPGATTLYSWQIDINIQANDTLENREFDIIIKGDGVVVVCHITQLSIAQDFDYYPKVIELGNDNEAELLTVISRVEWKIN